MYFNSSFCFNSQLVLIILYFRPRTSHFPSSGSVSVSMNLLTLVLTVHVYAADENSTNIHTAVFCIDCISLTLCCFCFCVLKATKLFMPASRSLPSLLSPQPLLLPPSCTRASLCWDPSVCLFVSPLCGNSVVLFCVCVDCPLSRSLWWRGGGVIQIPVSGQHLRLLSCPPGSILFTYVIQ